MGGVKVTQRHREDSSEDKDGQRYHSASWEIIERREMGGMKINNYEKG